MRRPRVSSQPVLGRNVSGRNVLGQNVLGQNVLGQRGFTLLEVLIALVILAIALAAVIKVSGQSAHVLGQLRADTAATVIAQDLCARLQLAQQAPALGTKTSEVLIDGQHWQVRQTVIASPLPGALEVTYFVRPPAPFSGQASITTYYLDRAKAKS